MTDIAMAREKGIPMVHLGGTSREELETQYRNMSRALDGALKVMRESGPHGRDYYLLGDSALQYAQEKHARRYNAVRRVLTEIEDDYLAFDGLNKS